MNLTFLSQDLLVHMFSHNDAELINTDFPSTKETALIRIADYCKIILFARNQLNRYSVHQYVTS